MANAWINELHYDNSGTDADEFIEIAGVAGTDLSGWRIVLYNGSNGAAYSTLPLTGLIDDEGTGFGAVSFAYPANGIQNGAPDAIALVGPDDAVVEFLSYEGSMTASDGPAAGLVSTDIGVSEPGSTPLGSSLQRVGTGTEAADFTWAGETAQSAGSVNAGQSFGEGGGEGGAPDPTGALAGFPSVRFELPFGAEIAAFDAASKRFFVTSGDGLQIVDGSDPFGAGLSVVSVIDATTLTNPATGAAFDATSFTSVAVANGILAAALPADDATQPGSVLFFDAASGDFLNAVTVGALPDMVTFTPDGSRVLVANEGEPGDTDPAGSVAVIDLTAGVGAASVATADFTGFDADALREAGVRIAPGLSFAQDAEPEYITVSPDGATAYVTLQENNAIAVVDVASATVTAVRSMGTVDHSLAGSGIDASDEDGVDIAPAPVRGMRMADAIATFAVGGVTYTVTANEGDTRDEAVRIKDIELDPGAFPDAAALQSDDAIGRLQIDSTSGDTDGDGDYDVLYTFGSRGFTIANAETGEIAYDSGDLIEQVTAAEFPDLFNAEEGDPATVDSRSDNRGPEPESVVVGEVDGVPYLFVGIEEGAGGVMVFDVSDPTAPVYATYLNTGGDIAPEGLRFISAAESPTGAATLAVANEVSSTLTLYSLEDLPAPTTLISAIQGAPETQGSNPNGVSDNDDASPMLGQEVTIEAVVTADFQDGMNGFYVQEEDADADGDARTSEGLFVFGGGTDVDVGDRVRITGTVAEFFGETQLSGVSAVEITGENRPLPTAAVVDLPAAGTSDAQQGRAQADLEQYEGMRVTFSDTLTLTEQFQLDRYNEVGLFAGEGFEHADVNGRPFQYTQVEDPSAAGYAAYLEEVAARTIFYDDGSSDQNLPIETLDGFEAYATPGAPGAPSMGDTIDDLTGVLSYTRNGSGSSVGSTWRVRATGTDDNTFEDTSPDAPADVAVAGDIKVASLNVLNYFTTIDDGSATTDIGLEPRGANSAEELARQEQKLVNAIVRLDADVLGLNEIENDFQANGGQTIAIDRLVDLVNEELGGEVYDWVRPGQEFVGGDAIAVGMIYKVGTVRLAEGTSTATLDDTGVSDELLAESTIGAVFNGENTSRVPLAATFEALAGGEDFTVVVNHLKSKSGQGTDGDADQGDGAGGWTQQRELAARALVEWLATNPTGASSPDNQFLLGDFNSYAQEDTIDLLEAAGFTDVAGALLDEAYSYVFDGLIGTLDYVFASKAIFDEIVDALEWHINSDQADAIDYNTDFGRDPDYFDADSPLRGSDHDPVLAGFTLPDDGTVGVDSVVGTDADDDFLFVAASLTAGDRIVGGGGTDTVELSGGGTFVLTGVTLASIEAIEATDADGSAIVAETFAQASLVTAAEGADDVVTIEETGFRQTLMRDLIAAGVETIEVTTGNGTGVITAEDDGYVARFALANGTGKAITFDADGNRTLLERTQANGIVVETSYDADGERVRTTRTDVDDVRAYASVVIDYEDGARVRVTREIDSGAVKVVDFGAGPDAIVGTQFDDTLAGGRGDDTLAGGEGDDVLFGGAGSDTFVYEAGNDRVRGFANGDLIDLTAFGIDGIDDDGLTVTESRGHTILTVEGAGTLRLDDTTGLSDGDFVGLLV